MAIGEGRLGSTTEDFRIGRVVSRTFDALFANPATFLSLSLFLSIPTFLISYYTINATAGVNVPVPPPGLARSFGVPLLAMLLNMVCSSLALAALTESTLSWLNGESPAFGDALSAMLRNFVPLIAISIVLALGIGLATLLLIVPGIILMTMWSVVVPVRVAENTGIAESFSRSRAMTRDYRWSIFLLFVGYGVVAWLVTLLMHLPLGVGFVPKVNEFTATFAVVDLVLRTILTALTAVGTVSIYYELRLAKEGIGDQRMAAAFD